MDDAHTLAGWVEHVRPGGYVLVSVPADPHRFGPWDELVGHVRRYTIDDLTKLFQAAGLDTIDVRTTAFRLVPCSTSATTGSVVAAPLARLPHQAGRAHRPEWPQCAATRVGSPCQVQTLTAINPDVNVATHDVRLGADNVVDILSGYHIVVDAADNFPVPYLLNDAALKVGIPVVHGSIFRFEGQVVVFKPHDGPCYRCFLPEPPPAELAPSSAEAGVQGVLPGIVGSIQAVEAIKLILGVGEDLSACCWRRLAGGVVPYLPDAARPGVPYLLDRSRAHCDRRVRRAVHAPPHPPAPGAAD